MFSRDWESLAENTVLIPPESLRYTYAIYKLVSIYGKERLSSKMAHGRAGMFNGDLSKILAQRSDIEADIREAFNAGGTVSDNTKCYEKGARELFQVYGKLIQEAVGDSEVIPTGYEKKEEWEKLRGYARGSL